MKGLRITSALAFLYLFAGCGPKAPRAPSVPPVPAIPENPVSAKDLGLRMIRVEPGKFLMGSPPEEPWRSEDESLHETIIPHPFMLGSTEVTQAQYERLTGTNPSAFRGKDLPVENVSWNEAAAFCAKLTENERRAGSLPEGMIYRLPTEAECFEGTADVRPSRSATPAAPPSLCVEGRAALCREAVGRRVIYQLGGFR